MGDGTRKTLKQVVFLLLILQDVFRKNDKQEKATLTSLFLP